MNNPPTPSTRRYLRPWPWLIALALAAAAFAVYLKYEPAQAQSGAGRRGFDPDRAIPVVVAPVGKRDVNVFLNGLGSVTPVNTVTVRTQVDGRLTQIAFKEGQSVRAGDLLAEIDARPLQAQLAQYEGQLARDQALLTNAELDLTRYRTLLEQDSIARQQVDTQEALVRQYRGVVKSDQGQIEATRVQLSYTRIIAPIGGRVGLRQVDQGNLVKAADTNGIVVITQLQPITAVFSLPEDTLPAVMARLQSGETIPVEAWNRERTRRLANGTLLTVDNQIDASTGTVKLKAQFPNTDSALFANQFVNVRLLIDVVRNAVVVPAAAVLRGSQGNFVYRVEDTQTVSVKPVKTGAAEGDQMVVESGLAAGDRVVVDGTDKLREGAKIEIATRDAAAAPAAPKSGDGTKPHRRQRQEQG